jgi:diguanylate cyclase (GGDEF)-like protein
VIEYPADDGTVSLADAIVLLDEVNRLSRELRQCETRLAELDRLAHSDPLVGLPNRRRFVAKLNSMLTDSRRHRAAMLFVDVDGLKAINDRFGHNAGDRAIAEVGKLLARSVRKTDLVARLAGDEFGVLLEPLNDLSAWQMALRIIATVDKAQFCVDGASLRLSVAVGVAEIRRGDTLESVFARADKEMYRIKKLRSPDAARTGGGSWPSLGTGCGLPASALSPEQIPFLVPDSTGRSRSDSDSALQSVHLVTS